MRSQSATTSRTSIQHGTRAFTLVELIVSMAASSVLMAGLAGAVFIVRSAVSSTSPHARNVFEANTVLNEMSLNLTCALTVPERGINAMTMTVPDRDLDGNPETIRYQWSGVAGTPLTWQYNNGTAVAVTDKVYAFSLTYIVQSSKLWIWGRTPPLLPVSRACGILPRVTTIRR